MSTEPLKVALIQMPHGLAAPAFLERAAGHVREAAAGGARLAAFPETVLPGYPAWLDVCRDAALWDHPPVKAVFRRFFEASIPVPGDEVRALGALARECELTLVIGVSERVDAGAGSRTLYNTLLTFGPDGRLQNHHRKLMPTFSERMVWGGGDAEGLRAVATSFGRVGGLICWEHWMPLARQALHEAGEDVHVAAWPTVKELNLVASRHYAFEGRCYVLAVGGLLRRDALPPELELHPSAQGGGEWLLRGGSCVFGPDGRVVVEPVYDREGVVVAELDPGRIAEEAMTLDTSGHYSRPDCLRLERLGGGRRQIVHDPPEGEHG